MLRRGASYDTADSDKRLAPERVSIWRLRARMSVRERVHARVYACVCIKALPVYHGV